MTCVRNNMFVTSSETQAPGIPTYVRTRTFTDSVIVSWRPPEENIIVRGYICGYGEGVPDVNWKYVDASNRNVTIFNLSKGIIMHGTVRKAGAKVSP